MANIFIYAGFGIMLLGAFYGIYVAVRGLRSRNGGNFNNIFGFQLGPCSRKMKKLIVVWGIVMIVGFIITGIGLAIGIK